MKNKHVIIAIILGVLIIGILAYINSQKKKPTDWKPTFYNTDTNPYGTYITYKLLKDVFNNKIESTRQPIYTNVRPYVDNYIDYYSEDGEENIDISFYNSLEEISDTTAYIFINQTFELDNVDLPFLLDFIALGNNVFISAERFSPQLLDTLKIKTKYNYYNGDSTYTLTDYNKKEYKFKSTITYTELNIDSCIHPVRTLAKNNSNHSVFVQMQYGKGNIFLHAIPTAFTNINMLNKTKYDFGFRSLSYIPSYNKILWDEYQKQGLLGQQSMLRVLLNNHALQLALFISILGLLLYAIFGAKRIQRIIPIIKPPVNSSIEFLNTISNLYYRKRDYKSITNNRHQYFLDYIRKHYYMSTENINDDFIDALNAKSGMPKDKIKRIFQLYNDIMLYLNISNNMFLEYNNLLEEFYKDVKNK